MSRALIPGLLAALCLGFASCGPSPSTTTRQEVRAELAMYEWHDDYGPGSVKVRINLAAQRAFFTRGGRPIGWCYVTTGKPSHRTPTGTFRITEKVVDKYSNRYGWVENEFGEVVNSDATPSSPVPPGGRYQPAPMPYWMRLTNYGIGLHAGPIPDPGVPVSHGCIRLPKPFAPILFDVVEVGTPVVIQYGSSNRLAAR